MKTIVKLKRKKWSNSQYFSENRSTGVNTFFTSTHADLPLSVLSKPAIGLLRFIILPLLYLLPSIMLGQAVMPDFINSEAYPSDVTSVTVTIPAGSQIGDLVMVNIVTDDDGAITSPPEFTELAEFWQGINGPTNGLYYRIIDGSEAASYVFSFPAEPAIVTTLRYDNAVINSTNPIDVSMTQTGNSANPIAPSVTTTGSNKTVLQFVGVDGASAGTLVSNSSGNTVLAADQSGETAGAEMMLTTSIQSLAGATPTGSYSFAAEEWATITLALNTYYVDIVSPGDGLCISTSTTLNANYEVSTSSGNFELVDPSGSVIATESYATSTGVVSFNFTPALTGNYVVREQSTSSLNDALTIYVDTDGDNVCDLYDMDDDNDGIIDNVESPNCYLSANDVPYESGDRTSLIDVSTEWTINNGTLSNILNGSTTDNAVRKANGDFIFSGQEFLHFTLSTAVTFDQIIFHHEGTIFLDAELVGVVQGSNDGSVWTDLTVSGTVLPDAASPHTLNLTQNLGDYLHYRVYVTSGRIDDDEYLREVEFSMIFDPLNYPLASCADDADGDQFSNHLDLDSDGDGCSDAFEAGATTDLSANFQFPSNASGANGLPDAVENPAESGVINYVSTYDPNATSDLITGCLDRDGDSVLDYNDQDTDNDGITDTEEDSYCDIDYNDLSNKQQIQISSTAGLGGTGGIGVLIDGSTTGNNFWYLNDAWAGDEIVRLEFPFPTVLTGLEFWIGDNTMIDNNTVTRIQGSNDGSTWEDMSPVAEFTKTAPNNTPGVLSAASFAHTFLWENTIPYSYYRLYGVSGGGNPTPYVYEIFFRTQAQTICDFDGDGLPNSLDLDSDGDGIPDNIEGQSTTGYVAPNADSPATYAGNNGINSAYLGGLPIPDTDTDGTPDFLDSDSDGDQTLDAEESGLPFTGIVAPNGMDQGVKTSDDYSDVNGIVNDPDTDLAKITTTTSEVDYRDKEPPIPLKVCHTSGAYNIGGTWFTFADEKLLNPANFGDNGISRVDITLHNFGTSTITEAALIANGCQVFQTQQTSEFNATEHAEISSWAQAMDHVLITSQQNVVLIVGSEYPNSGGNSNPNSLTEVGENVVNGPFGNIVPFNQGGSYQGAFDDYPEEDACVIIEDAANRPTGLLNRTTGDFYLADADLLSELGGLTSNDGISSSTDILFANLYHSIAQLVTEGPTNACDFFFCPAGDEAPILTSSSVSSPGLPVDLSLLYNGTPPADASLTWHNATPVADANYIGNATNYTESGIVYAAFRANDGSCYSPSTPVTVTIDYPDLELSITPDSESSAQDEVQSFTITVINNGPISAPDAVVKVPIPDEHDIVLANPSLGDYSSSTQKWNVGELLSGQSATLAITIRLQINLLVQMKNNFIMKDLQFIPLYLRNNPLNFRSSKEYFKYTRSILLGLSLLLVTTAGITQHCGGPATILAKWDFNTEDIQCNGAVNVGPTPITNPSITPGAEYCPNINNGCGPTVLGSVGHQNTPQFQNAICLANFYNVEAVLASGLGAPYDPDATTFDPEGKANLSVWYDFPKNTEGCLSSFQVTVVQKQFNGTQVNFESQGVAVRRNGVIVYTETVPITASNVNGTPFDFTFTGNEFCTDGSERVEFEIIFGLVHRLIGPALPGTPGQTGYDDVCVNGYCKTNAFGGIIPATCAGDGANDDAQVLIQNFVLGDRYDYNEGDSYTGSATYAFRKYRDTCRWIDSQFSTSYWFDRLYF